MQQHIKTNAQLMARCTYNSNTGKARYEDFSKYYPALQRNKLFNH